MPTVRPCVYNIIPWWEELWKRICKRSALSMGSWSGWCVVFHAAQPQQPHPPPGWEKTVIKERIMTY